MDLDVLRNLLTAEFLTSGDGAYIVENDCYIVVGASELNFQF